jgi:hypothetical protein
VGKQAGEAVQIVRALPRLLSTLQVIAIDRIYLKVISPDCGRTRKPFHL